MASSGPVEGQRIVSGINAYGFEPWAFYYSVDLDLDAEYEYWADMLVWAKGIDNQYGKEDVRLIRILLAKIQQLME